MLYILRLNLSSSYFSGHAVQIVCSKVVRLKEANFFSIARFASCSVHSSQCAHQLLSVLVTVHTSCSTHTSRCLCSFDFLLQSVSLLLSRRVVALKSRAKVQFAVCTSRIVSQCLFLVASACKRLRVCLQVFQCCSVLYLVVPMTFFRSRSLSLPLSLLLSGLKHVS